MSKPFLSFLFLTLLLQAPLSAQIWPGDINDNGIVNTVDILFLGHAFGYSGPARETYNQTIAWAENPAPQPWDLNFPGGLNFAFADCDGNGMIDMDDFWAIHTNYGHTHGNLTADPASNGQLGTAPPLFLIPLHSNLVEGAPAFFDVQLGTPDQEIEDFYGIAFSITYDPDVWFEDALFGFIGDGWIFDNSQGDEILQYVEAFPEEGRIDVAISRLNGLPADDGSGTIGSFFIVIEDLVVGLNEDQVETSIALENVVLLDDNMTAKPVYADSLTVTIEDNDSINSTTNPLGQHLRIQPNPCQEALWIYADQFELETLTLVDVTGRAVYQAQPEQSQYQIPTAHLPKGFYLLEIGTSEGRLTQQVIIQHP
ncbi:MAG: T9SS type A sorting domain-containing protein [Phaeodactylibacter sp.]|nr:T9SS type A sorting domain-containing protein [Phaeodactylibacter sp.]